MEILSIQLKLLEELNSLLERETREFGDMNLDAMAEVNRLKEELTKRIESIPACLARRSPRPLSSWGLRRTQRCVLLSPKPRRRQFHSCAGNSTLRRNECRDAPS